MAVKKVNVLSCDLDEELDQNGFRHRATSIGPPLGAERIGAGVYEAYAGVPIWPYHYHYGVEEWLYVLAGAPVLRDAGGRRELGAGDLVCFRSGHVGAHTVDGPGRFIIFSTQKGPPVMSVYPDSDKLSVAPTRWGGEPYDRMIVPRDAGVDYWYGEGDGGRRQRAEVARQPDGAPSLPVMNALREGGEVSGPLLTMSAVELEPGAAVAPYRYEFGREEWALVLDGTPTVIDPTGEELLAPGDVVCFLEGPQGARRLINQAERTARMLLIATTGRPVNVYYPLTDTWLIQNGLDAEDIALGPARVPPSLRR